jgi:hypothetical protein
MVESYYPENVFSRMSKEEMTSFWDQKGLVPDDWLGLCASHLCEVFSNDFVVPLQQTDSSFMLTVSLKLLSFVTFEEKSSQSYKTLKRLTPLSSLS